VNGLPVSSIAREVGPGGRYSDDGADAHPARGAGSEAPLYLSLSEHNRSLTAKDLNLDAQRSGLLSEPPGR
jgi:hypothetical protein